MNWYRITEDEEKLLKQIPSSNYYHKKESEVMAELILEAIKEGET